MLAQSSVIQVCIWSTFVMRMVCNPDDSGPPLVISSSPSKPLAATIVVLSDELQIRCLILPDADAIFHNFFFIKINSDNLVDELMQGRQSQGHPIVCLVDSLELSLWMCPIPNYDDLKAALHPRQFAKHRQSPINILRFIL